MSNSELGIAAVVVAMVVAIAVPRPNRRIVCSNEAPAIATLRNLGSAQAMFQGCAKCDLDGDGIGEFGTFGEMTGNDGLRADVAGATRRARTEDTVLSASLADVDEVGVVTKGGYRFRIWLPGARGGAVHEGKGPSWSGGGCPKFVKEASPPVLVPGCPFSGPVDIDAAETSWCAYAWPVAYGNSGNHTFFVNQGGDVWFTRPADRPYQGLGPPVWDAAMPADGRTGWSSAPATTEYRGRDGNQWKRTN